jgi:adenylate cyclase
MKLLDALDSEFDRAFARELARETLISERRRATILAGLLGGVLVVSLTLLSFFGDQLAAIPRSPKQWGPLLVGAGFAYELLARYAYGRLIRAGRPLPALARYLNVLVETSLPTFGMLIVASFIGPVQALLSPAAYIYVFFILLAALHLDVALCIFTGAVAALEYATLSLAYLDRTQALTVDTMATHLFTHLIKSALLLVAGVLAGLIARDINTRFLHALQSIAERHRVIQVFGQHVSPAVVDKLLAQPTEIASELRVVCLMFVDIRDFTTFAEAHRPAEVVEYLNTLFAVMIERIGSHHGIINKFLGDGFMAVFGAPLPDGAACAHAVAAAREIICAVADLNRSGQIAPTRVGIGIHAGEAVTGNVGSPVRKEYTIIGDTVNLAARIEQLNKQYGSELLISEAVWDAIGQRIDGAIAIEAVHVKGRQAPVRLFQLV